MKQTGSRVELAAVCVVWSFIPMIRQCGSFSLQVTAQAHIWVSIGWFFWLSFNSVLYVQPQGHNNAHLWSVRLHARRHAAIFWRYSPSLCSKLSFIQSELQCRPTMSNWEELESLIMTHRLKVRQKLNIFKNNNNVAENKSRPL